MIFDKLQMILLLAIAANLDNLGVGISYGLKKRYIPVFSNLIIALISTVLTFFAMIFGQWLERVLPAWAANDIGASIIYYWRWYLGMLGELRATFSQADMAVFWFANIPSEI